MAAQSNIVVKRADGTTDLLYEAVVGSAGDKSPAIWRSADGTAPAYKAELRLLTSDNGPKTARRADVKFKFPIVATGSDGITRIVQMPQFTFGGILSNALTDVQAGECVEQFCNLIHSAHVKAQLKTMFAAT